MKKFCSLVFSKMCPVKILIRLRGCAHVRRYVFWCYGSNCRYQNKLLCSSAFNFNRASTSRWSGPEVIKLFHAQRSWAWHFPANKYQITNNCKFFHAKTIAGIFIFISRENFMLSWVQHETCFIASMPDCIVMFARKSNTVELQWREHLWDHGNLF